MNRLLRPVVGILVAIAIAVSATVIAARFAPPLAVGTEPGVVTAPVLAPAATGDEMPDADSAPSETVSQREVTAPGSAVEGVAPVTRVLLDEMGAAADPFEAISVLEAEAAAEAPPTDGDPCAPREGEPPADCPDGLESTVLGLVAPRSLGVGAQAFPPTYERYLAEGNPYGGYLWCDGLSAGEGDVPFGVLATTPGTSTVSYWPTADPENVTTMPAISATEAEIDAYETALATETDPFEVPLGRACLVLEDLPAGTDYSARVLHSDIFGRIATSSIERFNTDGAPTRPGALITALGDSFIFASGLHKPDDSVDIRAWLYSDVAAADCSGEGSDNQLSPATHVDSTVTQDYLSSINSLPEYTGKKVYTFRVPEGATVVVCMRWFPAGDSPSWEREQHDYQSEVVLQSPDRILPIVTLADLRVSTDTVASVAVSASTAEGGACGNHPVWRPGEELLLPFTLCSSRGLDGAGVRVDDDRIWDLGFSGDILLTSELERTSGEVSTSSWLMPLSRWACTGVCELPETSWYTIRSWGDTSDDVSTVVRVDWEQGRQNGLSDWNVLPSTDAEIDYVTPELPQLDTTEEITVTVNDRSLDASARVLLSVDRPVDYTLRLLDISGGEACLQQEVYGDTRSGSTIRNIETISFSGLCRGAQYQLRAELTDPETGMTAVWGLVDRASWWGSAAIFSVPTFDVTISYRWMAQGVTRTAMTRLQLVVGTTDLHAVNGRGGPCTLDGLVGGSGNGIEASVGTTVPVTFRLKLRPSNDFSPEDCDNRLDDDVLETSSTVDLRLADLLRPEGVVIDYPEVNGQVHVWLYRP